MPWAARQRPASTIADAGQDRANGEVERPETTLAVVNVDISGRARRAAGGVGPPADRGIQAGLPRRRWPPPSLPPNTRPSRLGTEHRRGHAPPVAAQGAGREPSPGSLLQVGAGGL